MTALDQANQLAETIRTELAELLEGGAIITHLRTRAEELFQVAAIPGSTALDQHPVFTNDGLPMLRVQVMNGLPHPLATAWVPLPKSWFDNLGRLR